MIVPAMVRCRRILRRRLRQRRLPRRRRRQESFCARRVASIRRLTFSRCCRIATPASSARCSRIAAHDLVVILGAFHCDGFHDVGAVPFAMNMPHDLFMQVDQCSVAGAPHDAVVKIVVQFVVAGGIAMLRGAPHGRIDLLDGTQHVGLTRLGDARGGKLFEADKNFHGLGNFGGTGIGNHGADMRHQSHQSLSFQRLQRLPQWRARNAKLFAKQRLREAFARFPAVFHDVLSQMRKDLIVHRSRSHHGRGRLARPRHRLLRPNHRGFSHAAYRGTLTQR